MRAEIIYNIKKAGYKLDLYGSQTRPVENKFEVFNNYTYSICVENSVADGYITEKLFDGYYSETIPIYFGGNLNTWINEKALYKLGDSSCIEDEINLIASKSIEAYQSEQLISMREYEAFKQERINELSRLLDNNFG